MIWYVEWSPCVSSLLLLSRSLTFSVSQFCVLCNLFECNSCSIQIPHLPRAGLPLIQPSLISYKRLVSQNVTNSSVFPFQNTVQHLPLFICSSRNFLISNFIEPDDLFHLSPYPHSKASNVLSVLSK